MDDIKQIERAIDRAGSLFAHGILGMVLFLLIRQGASWWALLIISIVGALGAYGIPWLAAGVLLSMLIIIT